MFFSIIVPIYNVAVYLNKCIDSLLYQDIEDYEILLINDASTDNSLEIAKNRQRETDKIKLINKENNTGLSDTRNIGIKNSMGEYLLFVDSDDYIECNCLGKIKEEIKDTCADISYFGFYTEENGKKELSYTIKSNPGLYEAHDFMMQELRKRNLSIPACMACYRREFILNNRLFFQVGILHEDVRWSPIALYRAKMVVVCESVFYHYLIRTDSISHCKNNDKNGKDLMETCLFLRKYAEEIDDCKLKRLFKNYVSTCYLKSVAVNNVAFKHPQMIIRRFPIKNSCIPIDILRSLLFLVSPKLYSNLYLTLKSKNVGSRI